MSDKRQQQVPVSTEDEVIRARLRDILERKWNGVLNKMARDLDIPQPSLWKMVFGKLPASAKLLTAIAWRTDVDLNWLAVGVGPASRSGNRIPLAKQALPGPPSEHRKQLTAVPDQPFVAIGAASMYWLEIQSDDPILRHQKREQIFAGDWLLMETDRTKFPPIPDLDRRLVVAPVAELKRVVPKLVKVLETSEEGVLDIEPFNREIDPSLLEEEIVVREEPGGKLRAFRRTWQKPQQGGRGPAAQRSRPVHPEELYYQLTQVEYHAVLAVCALVVHRR